MRPVGLRSRTFGALSMIEADHEGPFYPLPKRWRRSKEVKVRHPKRMAGARCPDTQELLELWVSCICSQLRRFKKNKRRPAAIKQVRRAPTIMTLSSRQNEKSWLTITLMAWRALCRLFPLAPLDALPITAGRRKAIHEIAGGSIWAKRRHLSCANVDCHSLCSHQASSKKGQLQSERHSTSPTVQARHVLQSLSLHVRGRPRPNDHDPVEGAGGVIHAA
jgi:hypothetical protein